jgi:hypothetical protein
MSGFALRFSLAGGSIMRRFLVVVLVMAGPALVGSARAADNDPTGTWKWLVPGRGEGRIQLKLEGDKVTGVLLRANGEKLPVEDGIFKGGAISYRVPGKTPGGQPMVHMYQGKLVGDTIKGSATIVLPDRVAAGDWEAKRVKE